ncbi:anti-sigma factor domain-containing protein [Paenibacillus sp. NPDC058071]|uniref:anti-sigma-I factor RsgI family protein n=1 Tax=Paenibacillus sp. NPDC058071 TaxID=3346326 RepID=UPI0036D8E491
MKRGIVMEVNKGKAIVMTKDGGFVSVPHPAGAKVGEEIVFDSAAAVNRRKRPRRYWYAGATAAILLILLPVLFFVQSKDHPVVAYVSMDVNPSIEIGVDQEERVRELRALNDSGEQIIAGVAYKGQPLNQVAQTIMERIAVADYLTEKDKDIVVTSLMLNEPTAKTAELESALSIAVDLAIQQTFSKLLADETANVTLLSIPEELRAEAALNGISSGKMAVYLLAKDEGYEIELESMKKQSIDKATEAVGGVKTIVGQSGDASKEKLKVLVAKEKAEKLQRSSSVTPKPGLGATNNTKTAVQTGKPVSPNKPIASAKPKPSPGKADGRWKDNKDKGHGGGEKPNRPKHPDRPKELRKDSHKNDKDKGRDNDSRYKNKSNKDDNRRGGSRDGRDKGGNDDDRKGRGGHSSRDGRYGHDDGDSRSSRGNRNGSGGWKGNDD